MSERRGRRLSRYDDGYTYSEYESRPRHRSLGRQALDKLEDAMSGLGLTDSAKSHTSSRNHNPYPPSPRSADRYYPPSPRRYHSTSPSRRSRRTSRASSSSNRRTSSRSRSRWERGIEAAAEAAAVEAFRLRKEPGPWRGAKGGRIATAAISAGVIGAAAEKRKQEHGGGKLGTLGSALGGLVVNRLVNGSRDEVRR